jgi:Zn-dependent protease with chaperone function
MLLVISLLACLLIGSPSPAQETLEPLFSPEFDRIEELYLAEDYDRAWPLIQERLNSAEIPAAERGALELMYLDLMHSRQGLDKSLEVLENWLADPIREPLDRWHLKFRRVGLLLDGDRAVEGLAAADELLADPVTPEEYRPSLRWQRLTALQALHKLPEALAVATEMITTASSEVERATGYSVRADLYRQLGQESLALADETAASELYAAAGWGLDSTQAPGKLSFWQLSGLERWFSGPWFGLAPDVDLAARWLLCWSVLTTLYVVRGNRQRREGGGTWARLWLVAGSLALLTTIPLASVWIIGATAPGLSREPSYFPLICSTIWLLFLMVQFLKPAAQWIPGRATLPRAEPELVQQTAELARRMGVSPPPVQVLPSLHSMADAYAGGLVAPMLVIGDGIQLRLGPEERSAVLAHELGHLANHSLVWFVIVRSFPFLPIVALALWLQDGLFPVFWGMLGMVGMVRIASRWLEYDCDRRAAAAVGAPLMMQALSKIHMVHPLRNSGLWSLLAYATGTHPSLDERLAALARMIPEPEQASPSFDAQRARLRSRFAMIFGLVWLGLMLWGLLPIVEEVALIRAGLTALAALAPSLLVLAALRKDLAQSRGDQTRNWITLVISAVIVIVALMLAQKSKGDFPISELVLCAAVGVVLVLLWSKWRYGRVRKLLQHIQQRDFTAAVELAQQRPTAWKGVPDARRGLAVVYFLLEKDAEAWQQLALLRKEVPKGNEAWVLESLFLLEQGNWAQLATVLEKVPPKEQKQLMWRLVRFDLCIQQRDLAGAEQQLQWLRKELPESPSRFAAESSFARLQGDAVTAWKMAEEASRLAPGEAAVAVLKLKTALELGPAEKVHDALQEAERLVEGNPFCLCQRRLQRLRAEAQASEQQTELEFIEEGFSS